MRSLSVISLLLLTSITAFAQRDVDKSTGWSLKERMYFGLGLGGLGFGQDRRFGTYYSIGLTPMTGYMIARNFSGGLAFEYQYQGFPQQKMNITRYGWYPYLRYNVKNFFVQTDYDWYNIDNIYTPEKDRGFYNRFMGGIGYISKGRGNSAVNFLLSYDFLYLNPSQFNSPISIRIFMTF